MNTQPEDLAHLSLEEKRQLLLRLLQKEHSHPRAFPLAFAQQRLWFIDQLEPGNSAYIIARAFLMEGPLRADLLQQSLHEIAKRHEMLRTTFSMAGEHTVQIVAPTPSLSLTLLDLQHITQPEQHTTILHLATEHAHLPFDLVHGPLLRAEVIQMAENRHLLLLTMHHIISDGWSMSILMRELSLWYNTLLAGSRISLPDLPWQYIDYALWQRESLQGRKLAEHLAYWRHQLADLPLLRLPLDYPRPAAQHYHGLQHPFHFPQRLRQRLYQLSQQEDVTFFMTLLAAFQMLLSYYCAQDDIAIGTPVANRTLLEIEGLIGFFTNTLVLRTDLSGNPTFRTLLKRVRETTLEAYTYQDFPFEKLVDILQPERSLNRSPLFQVMLSLENVPPYQLDLTGIQIQQLEIEQSTAKFDLILAVQETENSLSGYMEYNTDLFHSSTIERMLQHLHQVLESIVAHPELPIRHHVFLDQADQQQLLDDLLGM